MTDEQQMTRAIEQAWTARTRTAPNPWVGAVVVSAAGEAVGSGATEPPGGPHAEIVALRAAGTAAHGATVFTTLEPCSHQGRTGPCAQALIDAGVQRVVVGIEDPDPKVAGRGIEMLRAAGIDVTVGVLAEQISEQLAPYLHHRRTGRPMVVAKVGMTLDGGTAAPDGTSQWITGDEARTDAHQLRAESGAIIVGAGTVRADDPSLTVRHVCGPDPLRVVLGSAPAGARVHPCLEWSGTLDGLLDNLGARGVLQVLVEGGASVLRSFHDADLVDRYVAYVAPALFGGTDKRPMLGGASVPTIAALQRGRFADVRRVGEDLRIVFIPARRNDMSYQPTNHSSPEA